MKLSMIVAVAVVLIATVAQAADRSSGEPFLDTGMRQVAEGDFDSAVFSLDTAVRKLQGDAKRRPLLVRAYLWLGAAYVGLDHETATRGKFREALRLDASVRPSEADFPPRVLKLFEEELTKLTAKKSTKKRTIAILAAGGAAAAGVAIAAKTAPIANRPPTAEVSVLPRGAIIPWVTEVRLWANASDPDGGLLSYAWDFGDGGTAQGQEVTHVFQAAGNARACVIVKDPQGADTRACQTISITDLGGAWLAVREPLTCVQSGSSLTCRATEWNTRGDESCNFVDVSFTFANPRLVVAGHAYSRDNSCTNYDCSAGAGELRAEGKNIECLTQMGSFQIYRP